MIYETRRISGHCSCVCIYSSINNNSSKTKELKEKYLSSSDWYFSTQLSI